MPQDFNNVNMTLTSINAYLKDNGVEVSAEDSAKLNSIFKESDTENAKGEKKADGELSRKERSVFLDKVQSALPKLFQKLVDFSIIVNSKEDAEKQRKETIKQLQQKTQNALNDPNVKAFEKQELERVEKEMQEEKERIEKELKGE